MAAKKSPWAFENARSLSAHGVRAVAFSPDGQHLASVDEGGTLALWNLERAEIVTQVSLPASHGAPSGLAFAPSGELAVAEPEGTSVRDGTSLAVLRATGRWRADRMHFGGGGRWLLAGASIYDPATLELLASPYADRASYFGWPHGAADPAGDGVLLCDDGGYDDSGFHGSRPLRESRLTLYERDLETVRRQRVVPLNESVTAVTFDARERRWVFASNNGRIEAWKADGAPDESLLAEIDGDVDALTCFAPGGALAQLAGKRRRLAWWPRGFTEAPTVFDAPACAWLTASPDRRWLVWAVTPTLLNVLDLE